MRERNDTWNDVWLDTSEVAPWVPNVDQVTPQERQELWDLMYGRDDTPARQEDSAAELYMKLEEEL